MRKIMHFNNTEIVMYKIYVCIIFSKINKRKH